MSQTTTETSMSALMQLYDNRNLIRKIKRAIAVLAPASEPLPESITGPTGAVLALPPTWRSVGIVSRDGYNFGREVNKEDVTGLGYASPVRSDITEVTRSVAFTPQEFGRKHLQELTLGMNLDGITQAANGEVVFDEPDLPIDAEYRLLVIGSDGPADNEWILGRGFPVVKLANLAEQVWGAEGAVANEITLDVNSDADLGTPVRHYMGGTGALKAAADLGYAQALVA